VFQIFTAEQNGERLEIEGFEPDGSGFFLEPTDTLELHDDGTVVVNLAAELVIDHWDTEDRSWWLDDTAPLAPVTFAKPVIFEQEDGWRGSIFMRSILGSAELRYISQESPLGQALMARGLVSVEPA
jgi:hypothetical protein